MSQWFSVQYHLMRDDVSAALNAMGPMRVTACKFNLRTIHDARFLFDDVTNFLQNRPSVTWVTFFALSVSMMFILDRLFAKFSTTSRKLGLPVVKMRRGWNYATLLEEGSKKYSN